MKNALTGEASPNYIFHLNGLELITRTLPGIKIIAILLDPVKRAFSHYPHMREQGKESLSFEQANEAEEGRLRGVTGKIAACNRHTKPVFADLRAGSINFWWRFDLHHHWGWRPLQGFQFLAIRIHRCAMRSSAPKQARTAEGSLPI